MSKFGLSMEEAARIGDPHDPYSLSDAAAARAAGVPEGLPSGAGMHIASEHNDGVTTFHGSPSMTTEHLGTKLGSVKETKAGYGSTISAQTAHAIGRGSDNKESAYDNPNSVIPPETKIAASVEPSIRATEDAVGLKKKKLTSLNY